MTVYDQFETEPQMSYSGSYGARVFFEPSSIYTTGSFGRVVLADSAGRRLPTIVPFIGKKYLLSSYPGILRALDQPYFFRNRFVRFSIGVDNSEQYHDSVVGHPISYINSNGITDGIIIPNGFLFNDTDANTHLGMPVLPPTSSIQLFIGTSSCVVQSQLGSDSKQLCDNIWNYTGPFQSRYKNVFKLKAPTYRNPFTSKSVVSQTLFGGSTIRRTAANLTCSFDSISLLSFVTRSGPTNEVPGQLSYIADLTLSASISSLVGQFVAAPGFGTPVMNTDILYKSFFGFGDGPHNFPVGFPFYFDAGIQYVFQYAPQLRGWKYGLIDGRPKYATAIWRYGKFGQMRDMLEQRPYTKFYNETTSLEAAVQVSFVSSSAAYSKAVDYVSATNPSYDPRDTGFYDYEYRSGHPFVDIEPTD